MRKPTFELEIYKWAEIELKEEIDLFSVFK